MFNTLHAMFMTQYTELWNAVDPVAGHIHRAALARRIRTRTSAS